MSSFDNLNITPAVTSNIEHRSECIPYYDAFWSTDADAWCLAGATLPIFTAPMACVVDDENYLEFDDEGIIPIIPRTVPFEKRFTLMRQMVWIAVGLQEFEDLISGEERIDCDMFICVDMANGHMQKLLDLCKKGKEKYGCQLTLMAGNVANPLTYYEYAKVGIDYIRCSVGSGGACRTNDLTGIGYPIEKLISEVKKAKEQVSNSISLKDNVYASIPKIVMDGGIHSIRDIIIAIALGADYVMCGKIFAKCQEASGKIIPKLLDKVVERLETIYPDEDCDEEDYELEPEVILRDVKTKELVDGRMYYGMSTERAQREMGNIKIKHSEGSEEWVAIEYNLHDWVSQFVAAISSTMSYCNKDTLEKFVGKVNVNRK